jgi:2-polyprenyl-6-methoxyphenol hydroxylase-like FAD-dependent oxidoreductase
MLTGSRVAIVGGSIAGCAAAIALTRAGCDVTVYERSRSALRNRGFGIGIPEDLHGDLVSAGYLDADNPSCRYHERVWFIRDTVIGSGRMLASQPLPICCMNWADMWRALRARIPDSAYHTGVTVTRIQHGRDQPGLTLSGGRSERFDLIVGADGYRSIVRSAVAPGAALRLSGYALWRGTCVIDLIPPSAARVVEKSVVTIAYPGGHGVAYLIPDCSRGDRLLNWAVYVHPPTRLETPELIPSGAVDDSLLGALDNVLSTHFPPVWADAIRCTSRRGVSVQPIYDLTTPAYVSSRLALIGDAGAVARPHTASGATTALLDALALERWCRTSSNWDEALDGYDGERCRAGNAQTALGRVLGEAEVTDTPDWSNMSPSDFERWWSAIFSGRDSLYG